MQRRRRLFRSPGPLRHQPRRRLRRVSGEFRLPDGRADLQLRGQLLGVQVGRGLLPAVTNLVRCGDCSGSTSATSTPASAARVSPTRTARRTLRSAIPADHTCSAPAPATRIVPPFPGAPACNDSTGTCVQCNARRPGACTGSTPPSATPSTAAGLASNVSPARTVTADRACLRSGATTPAADAPDDADCGGLPDTPACSPGGTCAECNSDDDCSLGEFCGPTGSCRTVPAEGKIAPTATTCEQYRVGTAADLTQVLYGVKGTKINNVAPGVLFYYTYLSDLLAGPNEIRIDQTRELTKRKPADSLLRRSPEPGKSLQRGSDCSTSTLRASIETGSGRHRDDQRVRCDFRPGPHRRHQVQPGHRDRNDGRRDPARRPLQLHHLPERRPPARPIRKDWI